MLSECLERVLCGENLTQLEATDLLVGLTDGAVPGAIAGALLAAVMANRFGRSLPLTVGILGGAFCYFIALRVTLLEAHDAADHAH